MEFAAENYFAFDDQLMPLNPYEDESHRELIIWERQQQARLLHLKEIMDDALDETKTNDLVCDIDYERVERVMLDLVADDNGLVKLTLPDLPWNGGREFNLKEIVLEMVGLILMSAREKGIRGVFTMVVNRNSLVRREDSEYSQQCLNGDPTIVASWMHNFVLAFVMDLKRTKTGIVETIILDQGSKMPVWDEKENDWDWRPDRKYRKSVFDFARCVHFELSTDCGFICPLFLSGIVRFLDDNFPNLVSSMKKKSKKKRYKILMLPQLLRPDIGTHDCLRRSDEMEQKCNTDLFYVKTTQQLQDWAWVRKVPFCLVCAQSMCSLF